MWPDATPAFGSGDPASLSVGSKPPFMLDRTELVDSMGRPWDHHDEERIRVGYQVPYIVSLTLFCVYAAPTITSLHIGSDPDAIYWIGRIGLLAWLVPVFLAVMHLVHLLQLNRGAPKRSTLNLSAIIPAVILAVIGLVYSSESAFLENHLQSSDCAARSTQPLVDKPRLQAAYMLGLQNYAECQERHFARNDNHMLPKVPHPTLQQCWEWQNVDDGLNIGEELINWKGYVEHQTTAEWLFGSLGFEWLAANYWANRPQQAHQSYWREWNYLAQVEANHVCGGFCKPGPSLFTSYDMSGRQGGKCAPLVGQKFSVIRYQGELVLWTSIISLVLIMAVLAPMLNPMITDLGYKGMDD